jgi:hypothetical protein
MTGRRLAKMAAMAVVLSMPMVKGVVAEKPGQGSVARDDVTKLVAKATDPASGAEIRVYTGESRALRVEVQDEQVFVSKRVDASGIELKVAAGGDAITIALTPKEMSVTGAAGRVVAGPETSAGLQKAREVIARSPAVAQAVALLAKVRVRPDSPLHHAILTTRAWLESATGPSAAARELAIWQRGLPQQLAARRVSSQDGPKECWEKYSKEAIEIAKDLDECMKDVSWYEIFDTLACSTIYDIRAIGAFVWWLNCIGAIGLF